MKATIVVQLELDEKGGMLSSSGPLHETDLKSLQGMPGGGMRQAAMALLVEAVRQEALLCALSMKQRNLPMEKSRMIKAVLHQMSGTIARTAEAAVMQAISTLTPE